MNTKITLAELARDPGCLAEYDPNAMDYHDAQKWIEQFILPVTEIQTLPIRDALGRILSEDIYSPIDVPNYDNSAMDGFVFSQSTGDIPSSLIPTGTILAGDITKQEVTPGHAIQIMTGGKIPIGGNTVIPFELVINDGNKIILNETPKIGSNIRRVGEDVKKGELILKKGKSLRPAEIGLLASLGLSHTQVYRRIKAAYFSTGNEVVSVGETLKIGQVYDSNNHTIEAMLKRLGADIIDLKIVSDDKQKLREALLAAASQSDVIITSGGVSVGTADFMKEILKEIGEVLFWKLAIKPGRPLAYGKINQCHYFGLPGNPVASMVTFYQIVQPHLKLLMGQAKYEPPPLFKVKTENFIHKKPGRMEFQRGILFKKNNEWWVRAIEQQGSAILSSMTQANCFIVLDIHLDSVDPGSEVNVQLLEGII